MIGSMLTQLSFAWRKGLDENFILVSLEFDAEAPWRKCLRLHSWRRSCAEDMLTHEDVCRDL